jgi:transposase
MPKHHSAQFKQEVIQYSLNHPEQTLVQTSVQFGLGHSTLAKWLSTYKLANGTNARSTLTADQQRIRQLEREVAHLREVNDIIKKAHVYFVSNPSK